MLEKTPVSVTNRLKAKLKGTAIHKAHYQMRMWWQKNNLAVHKPLFEAATIVPFFSSVYYLLFSRRFDREHYATLMGKLRYLADMNSERKRSSPLLRRNIHRLEKGLTMTPRRPVFALDFIHETVDIYADQVRRNANSPNRELFWARDVLSEYFDACGERAEVDRALAKFNASVQIVGDALSDEFEFVEGRRAPYRHRQLPSSNVGYDDFLSLAVRRRSVRWFDGRIPPRDQIDSAVQVAALSPTACNRSPYRFFIADEPDLALQIAKLAGGTGGYAHQIPCMIVVVGDLSAYFHERDRHLIYIDGSLASMSLILALESQGINTCAINWGDTAWREKKMSKLLNLAPHERPIMLIAAGYAHPDGLIPYSSKKEVDSIRCYGVRPTEQEHS